MKNKWTLLLVMVFTLVFANFDADAAPRRLGGSGSMGQQSSNVSRNAAPAPTPAPNNANNAAQQRPGSNQTPAAAPAPKKPWGAMLGGLAAGLGLAWLASSLGLGEAFGNILMFALLAMVALVVFRMIMARRNPSAALAGANSTYANGNVNTIFSQNASANHPMTLKSYKPDQVGNDASARPWEQMNVASPANDANQNRLSGNGSMIGSALFGSQAANWSIPADFDANGFINAAKNNFIALQAAWDRSDFNVLRNMMTDEMLTEARTQLAQREAHSANNQFSQTEVLMLEAKLLGIEDRGADYMASVEFSGIMREDASTGPNPFREVWNMTKLKTGGGWLVAGVQALS